MPSLIDRITAQRDLVRSVDPVTLEEFGVLVGAASGNTAMSRAGISVSAKRALGITAWYSGARYLAESVAGLPWKHYARRPDEERQLRADWPWLATPDVDQTWYGVVEHTVMALIHKGNGFVWKLRNPAQQVVGLREIHPDRVTGGIAPDGSKQFLVDRDPRIYTSREILHVPGIAYEGRFGLNPIGTLADAIGTVAAADEYSGRFFSGGTHVGGVISMPDVKTTEQTRALKQQWDDFHQGLRLAHQTGVLSAGATYQRISLNAADAQLIESRQYGVVEVARMLRIPPHKLYELSRATFSNIEHQAIEAVTDSVRPWVIRIEQAINADRDLVQRGHYIEASLEGMLRGDSAARADFYTKAVNGGWMMPSTAARRENEPSPPELDYYLRPLNMAVIRPGQPEEIPQDATNGGTP